jgi:hypothetical protein
VRSLRGTWCARHQSTSGYPKPADLCLGRAKRRETGVEARSRNDVQIFGVTDVAIALGYPRVGLLESAVLSGW